MAGIPKEHNEFYLDKLVRTQKAETVLSLIHASYYAMKSKAADYKEEIQKRLEAAYDLFKEGGSGTYSGTTKQFSSQYTIGHEMCIWIDSSLKLNALAISVAENRITIRDYFDRFFLNYFQPVNGKNIHPLFLILSYMNENNVHEINKSEIPVLLGVPIDQERVNGLCNFMDGTSFFKYHKETLTYTGKESISSLINKCNITYLGEYGFKKAYQELNTDESYLDYIISSKEERSKTVTSINYHTLIDCQISNNRIIFGAPGTGKSFILKTEAEEMKKKYGGDFERVTFHPDYSYANFVGTYKPIMVEDEISYSYVPGPFMRVLVSALKSGKSGANQPYLLVIEEINRANVAAVFGDVFQLLDRNSDGVSEYEIATSDEMRQYLAKELDVSEEEVATIRIPNNMFIWATMNSADQGVFPMDTAFKRRWDFTYLGIDDSENQIKNPTEFEVGSGVNARKVTWNDLRKAINAELSSSEYNLNEDKLMGPFFISQKVISSTSEEFISVFKNKVLMYLYDDAVKSKRITFFAKDHENPKAVRYSEVCKAFDEDGIFIFPKSVSDKLEEK